ncbi:hypothetical protein MHF_0400 [Mycoplasma haemofelis Ohio2]|uniref:Uncharacterized protein n=1 Tax=Mycoplasma haemofelis (strain Ohio2) TaxID=859194 RepID=F6FH71_MYCHI|nr:hypothetical protein MHF_0400 [Mycoplasma haemofelis Ohio2]
MGAMLLKGLYALIGVTAISGIGIATSYILSKTFRYSCLSFGV